MLNRRCCAQQEHFHHRAGEVAEVEVPPRSASHIVPREISVRFSVWSQYELYLFISVTGKFYFHRMNVFGRRSLKLSLLPTNDRVNIVVG